MTRLDIYFDYGSPYAYLAWHRIHHNPDRYAQAQLSWHPCSLAHIARFEGGKINRDLPNLARYNFHDVRRWAKAYGAPLWIPASFPCNSLHAARIHIHVERSEPDKLTTWMQHVWQAHWHHDKDISDPQVLAALCHDVGLGDAQTILGDDSLKTSLVANTQAAYDAGAPGVPYMVLHGDDKPEGFWGNDRLDWVEARLQGKTSPSW